MHSSNVSNISTQFHATEGLSFPLLLGYTFMLTNRVIINCLRTPPISIHPREARLLHNAKHPVFLDAFAAAAVNHESLELTQYYQDNSYALLPNANMTIVSGDDQIVKCTIACDENKMLKPGSSVIVTSPEFSFGPEPTPLVIPQFTTVRNENCGAVRVYNRSPYEMNVKQ